MAQNDPQYVITKDGQYLAHVGSGSAYTLTNSDSFDPATCLWYSGPNIEYNYYFIDGNGNYRYLSAPLETNGTLGLSDIHPGTAVLNKPNENYYFYDWDDGIARGVQLDMDECRAHENYHGIHDDECWKVVWVSYEGGSWQMSSEYGYNPTSNSARFRRVTITEHALQVTPDATNPGGAPVIPDFAMAYGEASHPINGEASAFTYTYTPAYTEYAFGGNTYYFDANGSPLTGGAPGSTQVQNDTPISYAWSLTGAGAEYLSLSNLTGANTTVSCINENTTTSHKLATLTLTVTYQRGVTEVRTATVTVKTRCQNPLQADAPVVTYENVTVSWLPTADSYTIYWQKDGETEWQQTSVGNVTSHVFNGLDSNKKYYYKVKADCVSNDPTPYSFTTLEAPDIVILGAIYGGGRMADVTGNTEVLLINCDSVNAVFGGNDIAGTVSGSSSILLGVDADDNHDSYSYVYNGGSASAKVRAFDVYGGGNGYYAYNGSSFEAASSEYNSQSVAVNGQVKAMTQSNQVGSVVWTNEGSEPVTLTFPKIKKTAIVVANDAVKVDSLFGGAKNAFLTFGDWHWDGDSIAINGGTIYSVFGGNNIGGGQGYAKHHIEVNDTKTKPTANTGYGRDFGIAYLFGGGNKVYGSTTEIFINGGQMDTIFAGGNSASVYAANLTVNCGIGTGSGNNTFGSIYSKAIYNSTATTIDSVDAAYPWDGTGVYNIRTLFGGNNRAMMTCLPNITLTSGSIGTVYGGGNAGDMMAQTTGGAIDFAEGLNLDDFGFDYSTKVVVNSPTVLVDYLYGGCQMSNVGYSTWVRMQNGHVGTVYGGCNISGDVGSTRQDLNQPATNPGGLYQKVYGATYVEALGGKVYKDIFAGSNGFYHCVDGFGVYTDQITYVPGHSYVGMNVPTHNETHVVLDGSVVVDHNVYAGGNMAPVGFTHTQVTGKPYPQDVGMSSVRMLGGEVKGDVYGGGRMASINGSNEVRVAGGRIGTGPDGGALYGGNDRLGKAGGISNRVLPETYNTASDNNTPLVSSDSHKKVNTYVGVTGNPHINTVYGGGNGAYNYDGTAHGGDMDYCDATNKPIQSNIFVDIAIDGGDNGGFIENVYGGGNGVHAIGFIKVFLNVQDCENDTRDHVGTIFGGNNVGEMDIIPDIILLHGNAHTVYGGCNQGELVGDSTLVVDGVTYNHLGGYVHLRDEYTVTNTTLPTPETITTPTTASVTGAVYGGCRMNGVTKNTLVLVDGGEHPASMFGGSDISGDVLGTSQVIVNGGTVGDVFGGGNGNYDYDGDYSGLTAPTCGTSVVNIFGGQVGASGDDGSRNVYGGGLGHLTSTSGDVTVNIGLANATSTTNTPTIYGDIYGGSALGTVNTNNTNTTEVNFLNGTLYGNLYGGGLGRKADANNNIAGVEAKVNGKVFVNISNENQLPANCFIDLRGASIFGCNNENGSPQDNVTVNVYQTHHTNTDLASYTESDATYAIANVFGGGNEANYAPENGNTNSTKKATVNIFSCDNTIGRVFGGGNKASAIGVATNVYGGRFNQVFGGGNGDGGEANIGAGGTNLMVSGGIINQLFGGSNLAGTITGDMRVNVTNSGDCTEDIKEFFGGSNEAPIGTEDHPADLVTIINCGSSPVHINTVYGGSNLADITGDVTVNIFGGEYEYVYGGSKGQTGTFEDDAADISGDVTLNLFGGEITNAFGGSNINGNINGQIIVNVLDNEASGCGLDITNIYGASNATAYTPDNGENLISPLVNVMHINNIHEVGGQNVEFGIRGNVFGGGNLAEVNSNPKLNIGYVDAMSSYIPTSYLPSGYTMPANPRAYVTGNVFGGGNEAAVNGKSLVMLQHANSRVGNLFGGGNKAGVSESEVNVIDGTVATAVYGGCNESGTSGDIEVNILNNLGAGGTDGYTVDVFGGGLGHDTHTDGNVTVTIGTGAGGATSPILYGNVYGGSAMGYVNSDNADTTSVWLRSGKVNGRVFGGGLGRKAADGVSPVVAEVNGRVHVIVDDGEVTTAVYGCNDQNGAPRDSVNVTINGGTIANVIGGGNLAAYTAPAGHLDSPVLYIKGGNVTHKVVGGGNAADITGNPHVNISGGTLCTGTPIADVGIYGGCNTSGKVTGDIILNITGDDTHHTTIGTQTAINAKTPVNIFGGGYGEETETTGSVTVNYGSNNDIACDYPKLYGDLYGGSALGHVNDLEGNDKTTVNVNNGSFEYLFEIVNDIEYQYGGSIYGGGLGRKAGDQIDAAEAKVYGEVHVNIGQAEDPSNEDTYKGQANLAHCNVYGCNNTYGSPQKNVFVDVYKSKRTNGVNTVDDADFAIRNLFGGGNLASYSPSSTVNTNTEGDKTHIYVHGCHNTIKYVYGGGNAADAVGTITLIDGGHFDEVFGGGNGLVIPADIGTGGVCLQAFGGHVNYLYEGSNRQGANHGLPHQQYNLYPDGTYPSEHVDCGALFVDSYFFGDNEAEHIGDLNNTITCAEAADFHYKNLYAGSRFALIYGDVTLRVQGGEIENLYGGSRGYEQLSADVRKFPTDEEIAAAPEGYYSQKVLDTLEQNPSLKGKRGNITLIIEGGKVGNVFGGCHINGNVEGKIKVVVDNAGSQDCPLFVGDVYGASDTTFYAPTGVSNIDSPEVNILNGTIGGTATFTMIGHSGSQSGGQTTQTELNFVGNVFGGGNKGEVISNPKVTIGDNTANSTKEAKVLGNIYGAGNQAKVTGDTKVILQGNTTVGTFEVVEGQPTLRENTGNVFGGGKSADVEGKTKVIIVPTE